VSANSRVKAHIADLNPYVPGKPIEELERELGITGTVKLASNENPLGPSPKAVAAMEKAVAGVHRYPDGASFALRTALAERLGVGDEQLVFGTGSDEILELISKAFLGAGDEVVFAWPSFAMYPIVAKGMAATPVMVPLDPDLVHDLDAMAKAITSRTQMVFVCNPNNPTGTSVGREAFDRFVAEIPEDLLLVVDEAYVEYVRRDDFPDAMSWVARRPGTAVLRTFSKIYGLAGARVGYGVMDADFASFLERARHPFNINSIAEAGALAALDDDAHVERSRRNNEEGIAFLRREMDSLGIRTWDSDANFVLAEAGAGVYDDLLPMGVIVRPMAGFGLPECIRITVGTDTENRRVIDSLRALRNNQS
jgi:histidinol-phosphate aminotransferase